MVCPFQFEDVSLNSCLWLMDKAQLATAARANPLRVSRSISAMVRLLYEYKLLASRQTMRKTCLALYWPNILKCYEPWLSEDLLKKKVRNNEANWQLPWLIKLGKHLLNVKKNFFHWIRTKGQTRVSKKGPSCPLG